MFLVQNPPSGASTPREPYVSDVSHIHRHKPNVEGSLKILDRMYVESIYVDIKFANICT
jgi:hypothetical protein